MRTQDEIVARIRERQPHDFLGFEVMEYWPYLDYEHAKPFLKEGVKPEEWTDRPDIAKVKQVMVDYMPFAWEKANGCRGISAGRSLSHYAAWLWLDGDDKLWPTLEHYEFYGKDQLRAICAHLGIDPDKWDDRRRVNSDMED